MKPKALHYLKNYLGKLISKSPLAEPQLRNLILIFLPIQFKHFHVLVDAILKGRTVATAVQELKGREKIVQFLMVVLVLNVGACGWGKPEQVLEGDGTFYAGGLHFEALSDSPSQEIPVDLFAMSLSFLHSYVPFNEW